MSRLACAITALACLMLVGCATQPVTKKDPRDPFERFNRATFAFNEAVDRAVARPVARAYRRVTPDVVEKGVSNFMDNLGYPVVIANDLLQGKFVRALRDTGRLLLNTTLGVGGLFDPATAAGLAKNDEDFGQTLGVWGVPSGPYLVLPFLGPSTVRDGFGTVADQFADPRTYIKDDTVQWSIQALRLVDARARLLSLDATLEETFDRYSFIRNAYLQRRLYLVTDGKSAGEAADEDWLEEAEKEAGLDGTDEERQDEAASPESETEPPTEETPPQENP